MNCFVNEGKIFVRTIKNVILPVYRKVIFYLPNTNLEYAIVAIAASSH